MDNCSQPPEWKFDQVEAAESQSKGTEGLPGILMRVSSTANDGLPVFMFLGKAKRLRDDLDTAIKVAEQIETIENNPSAALYGNVE